MFERTRDILGALVGLFFLWPILLAAAIGVKLTSKGPVFYRGVRTGRGGKPFRILKFRSMFVDSEGKGGTTTGRNDPRVTPFGRLIRKYKIDELPQLFNVLLGEMSLVGPRPEVAEYTDCYDKNERRILSVRPGITDFASLEFNDLQTVVGSEDPDAIFREKILPRKNALRLKYVDERTFVGDVRILLKTVALMMRKLSRGQS